MYAVSGGEIASERVHRNAVYLCLPDRERDVVPQVLEEYLAAETVVVDQD